jgi:hypothetical protein
MARLMGFPAGVAGAIGEVFSAISFFLFSIVGQFELGIGSPT